LVVAGCSEDDPFRHLGDGSVLVDSPSLVDLHLVKAGNGAGTVTSSPSGISCGATCDGTFAQNATVTLTATPTDGSTFTGWSGACTGTADCNVTLAETATVTATFTLVKHTVTVMKAGPGMGMVMGPGMTCDATCTFEVDHGSTITLTPAPQGLSVFAGWGGACADTASCELTVTEDVTATANFALDNFSMFVVPAGNGTGTVTSNPAGINCGSDCDQTFTANETVVLTATPATGSSFGGWSGGVCTGTGTCTVSITGPKTATATFTLNQYALTVTPAGNGQGKVTGTNIDCGSDCSETYDYNTMVTLTATPAVGSTFTGWSGACTGTGDCTVTIDQAKDVTATFTLTKHQLTVATVGSGTVTGTGISCGTDCTENYNYNSMITLTAAPATGWSFTGWSGACSGTGPCDVTMTTARSVTATFTINTYVLTITPPTNGKITGTGIDCGTDCSESYDYNTNVTLTATPATGYSFGGWTGACTGTGPCTVSMTAAKTVGATFTINKYQLTITPPSNGTITGTGINCGSDCSESYDYNTPVALTATPATGYSFNGWTGACSGTGPCSVTMTAAKTVGATFTINSYLLTVTPPTNGTITGSGITCGADCSESFTHGTNVTLTATPATGYSFAGWTGACSGTGGCTVAMTSAQTVGATFTIKSYLLTVNNAGGGSVAGMGITCGIDCTESFTHGTNVTLTAMPATGYTFNGWSGACSGTGSCVVAMTSAQSVTATFTLNSYALTLSKTGNGTITGGGLSCGTNCSGSYTHGTDVVLTATASTGYTFMGWSSTTGVSCPGTGTCTVPMTQAQSVHATFTIKSYALSVTPPTNGTVTGSGITCGNDCSETFTHGQNVVLTATPATGYSFTGWSSTTGVSCPGTGTCTVPMTQAQNVSATFTIKSYLLTVTPPSNGSVAGTGITCGNDCTETFTHGQDVVLTAMPVTGYSFTGWSSSTGVNCPGTGTCTVPMTQAQTVTATFTINNYTLSVTPPTNGSVTGSGISCGSDCSESVTHGTNVVLTATPATGYSFTGWSSTTGVSCPGTGTCTVPMTQAQAVSASFTRNSYAVTISPVPTGGSVSASGINCPGDCTETFLHGTTILLTATPATNYIFVGWSDPVACPGTTACSLTVTGPKTISANFVAEEHKVVVSIAGGGKGTVEGTGISCPGDCTESGVVGAQFTLTAKPELVDNATLSVFTGWSGACSGTGACVVTIGHANVNVTANFELKPNLMFVTNDTFNGQLDGLAGADKKCQTAAGQAGLPGNYVAYLSSLEGNTQIPAPSRVGGARGWTRVDGKPFVRKIDEFHVGQAMATPDVNEYGVSIANTQTQLVWTGTTAQGTYHSACSPSAAFIPWSGTSNLAMMGYALTTTSEAVQASANRCLAAVHLYCFGVDRAADLQ
jgi:uncharacterized repeat protein (TIGR02543 family)